MEKATLARVLAPVLGWLGALPFAALAVAAVFDPAGLRPMALGALVLYGAVILSFLGGVAWGLALAQGARTPWPRGDLVVGVTMSLIGFFAALAPARVALLALVPAFLAMLAYDLASARRTLTPAWFAPLRMGLTTAAVLSLLAGAYAA